MHAFLRIFGAGPLGVLLTIGSIGSAFIIRGHYPSDALGLPAPFRYVVLVCAGVATVAGVVWSFRSLPVARRGRGLCMQGAYRWVRHPLYASFITLGAPGLAIFLDHWVFLLWVGVLHILWHLVIPIEERLMLARFEEEYRAYAQRTGRFFPRLGNKTAA
jgi:protein-S-isoprenylcysteine O-methyltransferase Ste14